MARKSPRINFFIAAPPALPIIWTNEGDNADSMAGRRRGGGGGNPGGRPGPIRALHHQTVRDGAVPASGLLYANGLLYGTTVFGGGGACSQGQALQGCGTVFSLSP